MAIKILFALSLCLAATHASETRAQVLALANWQQPTGKVIQKNSAFAAANSVNVNFPSNVKAGNLLVACASTQDIFSSIADNQNNVWRFAGKANVGGSHAHCWYVQRAKAGATTVTIGDASGFVVVSVLEVSGFWILDQIGRATGTGVNVSISTRDAVDDPNAFVVAYAHEWDNYATWTAGSGYTMEVLADGNGSGYITAMQTKTARGTGVITATMTKNFPADTWLGFIMTFRSTPPVNRLVQIITNTVVGAASISATLPSPVRGGNTLIACFAGGGDVERIGGVDELGWGGYGIGSMSCQALFNVAPGNVTITGNYNDGPGQNGSITLVEVYGRHTHIEQKEMDISDGTTTSFSVSTPAPISSPTQYVFAYMADYWTPFGWTNFTPGAGYTVRAQTDLQGGKYRSMFADKDQKNGLTGIQTFTCTTTDLIAGMTAAIFTLK